MFIQVIQGKVHDAAVLEKVVDTWVADLGPTADGWLGSTGGVTADGTAILTARFESADAARRNSDRPEQGAWWQEVHHLLDGDASFWNCDQVFLMRAGGAD